MNLSSEQIIKKMLNFFTLIKFNGLVSRNKLISGKEIIKQLNLKNQNSFPFHPNSNDFLLKNF